MLHLTFFTLSYIPWLTPSSSSDLHVILLLRIRSTCFISLYLSCSFTKAQISLLLPIKHQDLVLTAVPLVSPVPDYFAVVHRFFAVICLTYITCFSCRTLRSPVQPRRSLNLRMTTYSHPHIQYSVIDEPPEKNKNKTCPGVMPGFAG